VPNLTGDSEKIWPQFWGKVHTVKANSLTDGGTDVKVKTNRKSKHDSDVSQRNQQTLFLSQATKGNRIIHQEYRFIPQKTKHKVFQRSGGCCEFIGKMENDVIVNIN